MEAYNHLRSNGELSERQYNVLQWLHEYNQNHENKPTARELHEWLAVDKANEKAQLGGPNYIKPRITELKEDNYITEAGKRECRVTERKAYTLRVVGAQEKLGDNKTPVFVNKDGDEYIFDPDSEPGGPVDSTEQPRFNTGPGDEEDSRMKQEVIVPESEIEKQEENCETTDQDESSSKNNLLFDKGEVVQ